jgi:general secretion pathway protein J
MATEMKTNCQGQQGFTLLELLIAMAIFAVMTSTAYFALNSIIKQSDILYEANTSLAQLQKTLTLLERDLIQMAPRTIRDGNGLIKPAILLSSDNTILEFTRGGRPVFGKQQSSLLRVQYEYTGDKLVRKTWNALDRVAESNMSTSTLLDNIEHFEIQLLGKNTWQKSWPEGITVDQYTNSQNKELPRAIRIDIHTKDFEDITRLIPSTLS